jgi:hypothetical protein
MDAEGFLQRPEDWTEEIAADHLYLIRWRGIHASLGQKGT